MIKFMIAAPASGSGKTTMTCALLAALSRRGRNPWAFKCGPDYIDPMFHRAVLGVDSCNLDLFLSDPAVVRQLFAVHSEGHGAAVAEGVMGLYDGVGGTTDRASSWHLADTLGIPVLLVVRPGSGALTLAASLKGLCTFRENSRIAGILLNDCTRMRFESLAPLLERETGVPVLGFLPHMESAVLPSRHLGLIPAGELPGLQAKIDQLARQAGQTIDLPRLECLCGGADENPENPEAHTAPVPEAEPVLRPAHSPDRTGRPVIAVARDAAFCFCYSENLDLLRENGAEPVFFSPLRDTALPDGTAGLYLPGGYPELYAEALSKNTAMREAIRDGDARDMPILAECGGFLYLGQALEDSFGTPWPMVGVLPGSGQRTGHPVRFGYASLTAAEDSMLFHAGETVPVHSFHYWDSTEPGTAFHAEKPLAGRTWETGFVSDHLSAAFEHLYFPGCPAVPRRLVRAAEHFQAEHMNKRTR